MPLTVADFGVNKAPIASIQLAQDDPVEVFEQVISGNAEQAKLDMVAINTAVMLWLADISPDLSSATQLALSALKEGKVKTKLAEVVAVIEELN